MHLYCDTDIFFEDFILSRKSHMFSKMFLDLCFIKRKNRSYVHAIINMTMVSINSGTLNMSQGLSPCDLHRGSKVIMKANP